MPKMSAVKQMEVEQEMGVALIQEKAKRLLTQEKWEETVSTCSEGLGPLGELGPRPKPGDPCLLSLRALACIQLGRLQEAEEDSRRVLDQEPFHVEATCALASCQVALNDVTSAVSVLTKCIDGHSIRKTTSADSVILLLKSKVVEYNNLLRDRVFKNDVFLRNLLTFLTRTCLLNYRRIDRKWNELVVSTAPQHKQLEASCSSDNLRRYGSTIRSSAIVFAIRRFTVSDPQWKKHLRCLVAFPQVQIDALTLAVDAVGPTLFATPMNPTYFVYPNDAQIRARFTHVNDRVVSLPSNLNWLGIGLKSISHCISPARFEQLKELRIDLTCDLFMTFNFSDRFFEAACSSLQRNPVLHHQLPALESFTCGLLGNSTFQTNVTKLLGRVASRLLFGVCQAAPALKSLGLESSFMLCNVDTPMFVDTFRTARLGNLQHLNLELLCHQNELDGIVGMLDRSGKGLAYLSLIFAGPDHTFDLTGLLKATAPTLEQLFLSSKKRVDVSSTRWPVMKNVKSCSFNLEIFHQLGHINFGVIMPALTSSKLEYMADNTKPGWHDRITCGRIRIGLLEVVDIPAEENAPEVVVTSDKLQRLEFNVERGLGRHGVGGEMRCPRPFSVQWNCPQLTSLTLSNMGCVPWFLWMTKQFPCLHTLDVTISSHGACEDEDFCFVDFAFTGLKRMGFYAKEEVEEGAEEDLRMLMSQLEVIADDIREDCLIHRKSLRNLTVRQCNKLSDCSCYQGFALMTHLENLTVEPQENTDLPFEDENNLSRTNNISDEAIAFVKNALPKTRVDITVDRESESEYY